MSLEGKGPYFGAPKGDEMTTVAAVRKRVSTLWGVAPYRIEVEIQPDNLRVEVDGQPPTPEQRKLLEDDIVASTSAAKREMN